MVSTSARNAGGPWFDSRSRHDRFLYANCVCLYIQPIPKSNDFSCCGLSKLDKVTLSKFDRCFNFKRNRCDSLSFDHYTSQNYIYFGTITILSQVH